MGFAIEKIDVKVSEIVIIVEEYTMVLNIMFLRYSDFLTTLGANGLPILHSFRKGYTHE